MADSRSHLLGQTALDVFPGFSSMRQITVGQDLCFSNWQSISTLEQAFWQLVVKEKGQTTSWSLKSDRSNDREI